MVFVMEASQGLLDEPVYHLSVIRDAYSVLQNGKQKVLIHCLPLIGNKTTTHVLNYLCDLVKLQPTPPNMVVADHLLLETCGLEMEHQMALIPLLQTFYSNKYIPFFQTAVISSKSNFRAVASDWWRRNRPLAKIGKQTETPPEGVADDENHVFKFYISIILQWKITLGHQNILRGHRASELLESFQSFLSKNVTKTQKSPEDILESFFSSKEILNLNLNDALKLSSKNTAELHKSLFIIENYNSETKQLDTLTATAHKIATTGQQNFAGKVKVVVGKTFKAKHQDPLVDKVFQKLNFSIEETISRKTELEELLSSIGTFENKVASISSILDSESGLSDWGEIKRQLIQTNEIKEKDLESFVEEFVQEEKADRMMFGLKRLEFTLKYGQSKNLHIMEMVLIKVCKYLKDHATRLQFPPDVVVQFVSNHVPNFWNAQLKKKVVGKVRERFTSKAYRMWTEDVMKDAQILLESNVVLETDSYLAYLKLKLSQVIYFSLICGKIENLKSLKIHKEGDELHRLRSILEELENVKKTNDGFGKHTLQFIKSLAGDDKKNFCDAFTNLFIQHDTPTKVYNACEKFVVTLEKLLKDEITTNAPISDEFLNEMGLSLVPKWDTVQPLFQLHGTNSTDLDSLTRGKINKLIGTKISSSVIKRQSYKEFLKILKQFTLQDFKGGEAFYRTLQTRLDANLDRVLGNLENVVLDPERVDYMIAVGLRQVFFFNIESYR